MIGPIEKIADSLYVSEPSKVLYHYTSIDAIGSIVQDKALWATDIHYFNDEAELKHAVQLLLNQIRLRQQEDSKSSVVLGQLERWLADRVANGHMLFVTAFTENGNLLSQWRGYCEYGKGLSLGFSPSYLLKCAFEQKFQIGRCIYDLEKQKQIAEVTIDAIVALAEARGLAPLPAPQSQSYYPAFAEAETALLRIAAVLKHPAFREEEEWRAVSRTVSNYVKTNVKYRPGSATLIPYLHFELTNSECSSINLEHVYLGPTSQNNLSMDALSRFLSKNGVNPQHGVTASQVPYRNNK